MRRGFEGGRPYFDQFFNAFKNTAPNPFAGDFTKPPFDQIKPGRTGRNEVQVKSLMSYNPLLDLRMLVRGIVIDDQMQVHAGGSISVHLAEKLQKFLVPMPIKARANHGAIEHIERS